MTSVSNLRAHFDDPDPVKKQSAARNTALKGALSAFPKPAAAAQSDASSTNARDQSNARSAASVVAGRRPPALLTSRSRPDQTSNASLGAFRAHKRSQDALYVNAHRRSIGSDPARSESPSNVAAVIAAARFSPQSPSGLLQPKSPHHFHARSNLRSVSNEQVPEEEQVPAHGTVLDVKRWLLGLEDKSRLPAPSEPLGRTRTDVVSNTGTLNTHRVYPGNDGPNEVERRTDPKIVSPRPIRAISVTDSLEAKTQRDFALQDTSKPKLQLFTEAMEQSRSQQDEDTTPHSAYHDAEEVPPLLAVGPHPVRFGSLEQQQNLSGTGSNPKPAPPPPRRAQTQLFPQRTSGEFRSRVPQDVRRPAESNRRSLSTASVISGNGDDLLHIVAPRRSDAIPRPILPVPIASRKITPHMTGDSLANAIVASSLASSRAPSPTKSPGPSSYGKPVDRSRLQLPFRHKDLDSRTPSPAKGMRQTLRKPTSSSDEDDGPPAKASRKFFIRKHPHKHHEGDRKRWRNELTELERKRYDGLWAANRGLHVQMEAAEDLENVSGLVVRDIWRRSRLPDHVLEEVWDLADTDGKGNLTRAEFVVGLWLIDQRLKGRKLPTKVQPSIWRSARGIHGLKVRNFG